MHYRSVVPFSVKHSFRLVIRCEFQGVHVSAAYTLDREHVKEQILLRVKFLVGFLASAEL